MTEFALSLLNSTTCAGQAAFEDRPALRTDLPDLDDDEGDAAEERVPSHTYRLDGDRDLATTWQGKALDNIAAIELLKQIEAQNRHATPEEQQRLASFIGFGATQLSTTMFRRSGEDFRDGWQDIGARFEAAITPGEKAALTRSTQYAHYTPELLARGIWNAVTRMGFKGGKILEPGCGTGMFLATIPEKAAARSVVTGIEMETITAGIARKLFPEAWICNEDFTKSRIKETYSLAIGNVPFSNRTVRNETATGRLNLSLHEYFVARAIEQLEPGGVAAFVTSHSMLDRSNPKARQHIASMANLLGALRMPEGSMSGAGTNVVVDIVFFQRRAEGELSNSDGWLDTLEVLPGSDGEAPQSVNRHFAENPGRVLGRHGRTSSQYGVVYTCEPDHSTPLAEQFAAALSSLPANAYPDDHGLSKPPEKPARRLHVVVGTAAEGARIKEGSYLIHNSVLSQIIDGMPVKVRIKTAKSRTEGTPTLGEDTEAEADETETGFLPKEARIIQMLIPVRDSARSVIRAQEANEPWAAEQARLRTAYMTFVRSHGPINLTRVSTRMDRKTGEVSERTWQPNLSPFNDDPDAGLVAAIEDYDEDTGLGRMGALFNERVIRPPVEPVITCAADALAVTLNEVGYVDIDKVAERLGCSRQSIVAQLGKTVYLIPETTTPEHETWDTADAYLSGAVRTKLAAATAAAALDTRYERNVIALKEVQPVDLKPSEITARLGAPWIPTDVIELFSREVIEVETWVKHTPAVACWTVDQSKFVNSAQATSVWGTERRHAGQLLWDALNASIPAIYDTWEDSQGKHRVLNATDTEAAKAKLTKLRLAFEAWIWTDTERAQVLSRIYNDVYNNLVPRSFNGDHLTLPGASTAVSLRPHQKRVVSRIILAGRTYMAHSVGTGKTFSIAAAIMEQIRLALITKAMMVVPGHCLAQARREFLLLYPNANILVADEANFTGAKRRRFVARAATGRWDCIIITHSAFKFISVPSDFETKMVEEELELYEGLLNDADTDDRVSIKQLARMIEGLQESLDRLKTMKDNLLTISEIGVDQIVVDEAQEFRKLRFASNMGQIKGIDTNGSQRSWDLHVKNRFISTFQPTRALILASGTPICNTLGEMYHISRFMHPELLESMKLHEFDAWASAFGDTKTELELQPSGAYMPVTRFAEFVNVPELISMFRSTADVVVASEIEQYLDLPQLRTGRRQLVTSNATPAFRSYQKHLENRIKAIQERTGAPQKGDDILLSVITDGRHAAIDMRLVKPTCSVKHANDNETNNKLNKLIRNAYAIWERTSHYVYMIPGTTTPAPLPGGTQMIFSDLGTEAVAAKRGFSAYTWIHDELVRLGVPGEQIAIMQHFKKAADKLKLYAMMNLGKIRFLLGSTQTMGTGVNAQWRLVALHHLDVPWLPSDIEQREGRIRRQKNQNKWVEIFAYATKGSVDATMWQILERKLRFIMAALSGDRSIRRLEDIGHQVSQFATAKAIASGDQRLLQKGGLDAEVERLDRLRAAHFDAQMDVQNRVSAAQHDIAHATIRIRDIEADIALRIPTRGDLFSMEVAGKPHDERKTAGAALLDRIDLIRKNRQSGEWLLGRIGGFSLRATGEALNKAYYSLQVELYRTGSTSRIGLDEGLTPLGIISRLESCLENFEQELTWHHTSLADASTRLPGYQARLGEPFAHKEELAAKQAELQALEEDLQKNAAVMTDEDDDALAA